MGIMRNGHNEFGKYGLRPFDKVNMAVGDGVKGSGVDGFLAHVFIQSSYKTIAKYRRNEIP